MTTQPILLKLAQQGDARAITALMNEALQSQHVRTKASLQGDRLQVLLKSSEVLDQHACVAFVRRGMLRLQADSIKSVRAYAWQQGREFPTWIIEFSIEPVAETCLDLVQLASIELKVTPALAAMETAAAPVATLEPAPGPESTIGDSLSSTKPVAPVLRTQTASSKPTELLKLGVVVVVFVMMYFAVIGV